MVKLNRKFKISFNLLNSGITQVRVQLSHQTANKVSRPKVSPAPHHYPEVEGVRLQETGCPFISSYLSIIEKCITYTSSIFPKPL